MQALGLGFLGFFYFKPETSSTSLLFSLSFDSVKRCLYLAPPAKNTYLRGDLSLRFKKLYSIALTAFVDGIELKKVANGKERV